jgi:hypothetical protein
MTFSIIALCITTCSIMTLSITIRNTAHFKRASSITKFCDRTFRITIKM